jgi:hypothetical protein
MPSDYCPLLAIQVEQSPQRAHALLGRGAHCTLTPSFGYRVRAVLFHTGMKCPGFATSFTDALTRIAAEWEAPHAPLTIAAGQDP